MKEPIKEKLVQIIEMNKEKTISLGRDIFEHPELGFKEQRTSKIMQEYLIGLGLEVRANLSVTGVRASQGEGDSLNIGLIAELDAIPTPGHRCSSEDKEAAHACAHSNQVAIMLAVMQAIKESGMLEGESVKITLIGTPAEEFTDFEYRRQLLKEKKIKYMSGKQDMINSGVFDDIDLLISCHTMGGQEGRYADINSSLNGFLMKKITYHGKSAHAGATPELGINALNAANIGLVALNAQRETFKESDMIRVHGIITEGGQTVNSVPERVTLESYVRGIDYKAIMDANEKVNRAYRAGAYAVGATCQIDDTPGYMPFTQCKDLSDVLLGNLEKLIEKEHIFNGLKSFASGDIGDVASIIPTIQFGFSGFRGNIHGSNFEISDEEMAYIIPAKAIAMTLWDLVQHVGALGRKIRDENPCLFKKDDYLKDWLKSEE